MSKSNSKHSSGASHRLDIGRGDFLKRAGAVGVGLAGLPLLCAKPNAGKRRTVFITGSSSGLGFLSGKLLVEQGHKVVLHARNEAKAKRTKAKLPGVRAVVVGDVSTLAGMRSVAKQVNALGTYDAVIHNVGLGTRHPRRETVDGVTQLFAVNTLTPYVLTALMKPSERLIYLSSGLHKNGDASLRDLQWKNRPYNAFQAYSDTKLHDLLLTLWLARKRPRAFVNAVHPGWVPTKMGGPNATDDLLKGAQTQAWLAVSDDSAARVSGKYWFHKKPRSMHSRANEVAVQDKLIAYLEKISGLSIKV